MDIMSALKYTSNRMENKLIELMGTENYVKWSTEVARDLFAIEVDHMEDSPFKKFCEEHFIEITR